MKVLVTLALASLVFGAGIVVAQDEEPEFALASKIIPVEAFLCNYNDGQGPADLTDAVDGWNAYMDKNDVDTYAAWTLTKNYTGPDQEFDFIWLGAWADGNAMGVGDDMMRESGGEYIADFFKVANCGVHINSASINYKLPEGGTPGNGVLTFSNCTVNDGKSYAAIAEATHAWADVLTEAGSKAALYHWFPIFGGGGDSPDFTVVTAYANYSDLGADYERRTNGELFRQANALYGDLMDCDVARVYDTQSRRNAQLR